MNISLVIHCYIIFWNVIARLAIRNIKISQDIINFWLLKEEWLLNRIIISLLVITKGYTECGRQQSKVKMLLLHRCSGLQPKPEQLKNKLRFVWRKMV